MNPVNCVEDKEVIGTPEIKKDLEGLIKKYDAVFTSKIGKAIGREYQIKIKSDEVVNLRPYPLMPPKRERVQTIIQDLLEQEIIRPSNSPYSSPSFLVTKDNKDRLVINFSEINKLVQRTAHPLGDLQDCVHYLTGAKFFSVIDLV